jgi:serine/threonine protein kinase
VYCPAETAPLILEHGEQVGDIEVVRPISILRSSVLYEARQGTDQVLLKVAHPDPKHIERLKNETRFLRDHGGTEGLPKLLSSVKGARLEKYRYGRAVLGGHLMFFCLFRYFKGETLRDLLTRNPQPWINHVGWIMRNLGATFMFLDSKGLVHYGLSPEAVLINIDDNTRKPQVLLLDLGIAATSEEELKKHWYGKFILPAYAAPELVDYILPDADNASPRYAATTEVYGLGVLMYELLEGRPAFPFHLRNDREVLAAIEHGEPTDIKNEAVTPSVTQIVRKAMSRDIANRYRNASEMVAALRPPTFPKPTPHRPGVLLGLSTAQLVAVALLAITLLLTAGIVIWDWVQRRAQAGI